MASGRAFKDDELILDSDYVPAIKDNATAEDKKNHQNMTERPDAKPYILYPEDHMKVQWDLFITLILLISCMHTPLKIAFQGDDPTLGE